MCAPQGLDTHPRGVSPVRFYASAVLRSAAGRAYGVLCVTDSVERKDGLSELQRSQLQALLLHTPKRPTERKWRWLVRGCCGRVHGGDRALGAGSEARIFVLV